MHPELNSRLAQARVADLRRAAAQPTGARRPHSLPAVIGRLRTIRGR